MQSCGTSHCGLVKARAVLDQRSNNVDMSPLNCKIQWRFAPCSGCILVSPSLKKHLNTFRMAPPRCIVQGRLPIHPLRRVQTGARLQEQANHLGMPRCDCQMQGCFPHMMGLISHGSCFQQQARTLKRLRCTSLHAPVQWRPALRIGEVGIYCLAKQLFDFGTRFVLTGQKQPLPFNRAAKRQKNDLRACAIQHSIVKEFIASFVNDLLAEPGVSHLQGQIRSKWNTVETKINQGKQVG